MSDPEESENEEDRFIDSSKCTSNHIFQGEIWHKNLEVWHKFGNLAGDIKISKNERSKFSQNFTNRNVIPG